MRILIVDDIHEILLDRLRANGVSCDYQPQINRVDTEKIIEEYDGLVIRSKFQVDRDFLDLAPILRLIGRAGAGMVIIDVQYAQQRVISHISDHEGIRVPVAEHWVSSLYNPM